MTTKKKKAPTGTAYRPDGCAVLVTIPAREESEDAEVVRLADEVIAAANAHSGRDYPWERADLVVRLCLSTSGTTWTVELGRARVDGTATAVEALTALLTIVKRYQNTTSRGA
jgi:hypothetical protein